MEGLSEQFAKYLEAKMLEALTGPARKQRQTALRLRGNGFETVELDDAGNVIEPPRPCPKCGPVFLCAAHMAQIT